jgi:hypothetical protein
MFDNFTKPVQGYNACMPCGQISEWEGIADVYVTCVAYRTDRPHLLKVLPVFSMFVYHLGES